MNPASYNRENLKMKAIVASLFIVMLNLFAMPVHAEWKPYKDYDKIGPRSVYSSYTGESGTIHLIIPCKNWRGNRKHIRGYLDTDILGHDYVGVDDIQVQFDDIRPFKLRIHKYFWDRLIQIIDFPGDRNIMMLKSDSYYFLSRMKARENLSIRITLQTGLDFIARFDISGFTKVYDSHCGYED